MRAKITILLSCVGSVMAMHEAAIAQVPPPVLQDGQKKLAQVIIKSLQEKNIDRYSSTIDENVQVYEDNRIIAIGRRQWLGKFSISLKAPGLRLDVNRISESSGKLMTLEHFNSKATYEAGRSEGCCEGYVAVVYEIKNGKVWKISRLTGGMIP